MLGDGRLGDVEARREVLHSGLSTGETFKNGASAWVRQSAEDGGLALHGEMYKSSLMECQATIVHDGNPSCPPESGVGWCLAVRGVAPANYDVGSGCSRSRDETLQARLPACSLPNALVQRRRVAPSAATGCWAAYSAIRVFTSFRTSVAGKGLFA